MLLSETKAKGMMISLLKHVENDFPKKFSCHIYRHLTLFHSLLIANQNCHKQLPNFIFHTFSFCLVDINISVVLSLFIIIPFSRHQILSKFNECCSLFSNIF